MSIKAIFDTNNLVIQHTTFTCGPCAILNVLHLEGDFSYDEHTLAMLCDAQPGHGTSNEALIETVTTVGLQILEEKQNAQIHDIEQHIDNGAYVIVNYVEPFDNDGHYAVVTEYDEQALYLRDSFFGLLRLKKEDFEKFWYNSDKTIHRWYLAVT